MSEFTRPERKPDVCELMTQKQVNDAIVEWMERNGRLPNVAYEFVLLTSNIMPIPEQSSMRVEAWKKL